MSLIGSSMFLLQEEKANILQAQISTPLWEVSIAHQEAYKQPSLVGRYSNTVIQIC